MHTIVSDVCYRVRRCRLSGTIPPEIGDLIYLRNVDFNGNAITGSIPPTLGQLQLEVLRLGNNQVIVSRASCMKCAE